jgi:hypothetical protein
MVHASKKRRRKDFHMSKNTRKPNRTETDGILDKEATSYNDIFDAFRLVLSF